MRHINEIVIHCSATKETVDVTVETVRKWHTDPKEKGGRGWSDIGYHFYITKDGRVWKGRPIERSGAHVFGHNKDTLGICYEGGLDSKGKPKDTRTDVQKEAIVNLIIDLLQQLIKSQEIGDVKIKGHRDYSEDKDGDGIIEEWEWMKACPCFDAEPEYRNLPMAVQGLSGGI